MLLSDVLIGSLEFSIKILLNLFLTLTQKHLSTNQVPSCILPVNGRGAALAKKLNPLPLSVTAENKDTKCMKPCSKSLFFVFIIEY